jgi:nitrite reductase/ring-hydroxylating ferredoxin subunit
LSDTRAFVRVAPVEQIPPGRSAAFTVEGQSIAIFNWEGELFAVDNHCPHQNAPLAGNPILPKGRVRCMVHGWLFQFRSCEEDDDLKRFPVRVEDGQIEVSPQPYPSDHIA